MPVTHSYIDNHERKYYYLPLTATIHDSPTLNSIAVGKEKSFIGEYRFKLTTILAIQYKLNHHIW